MASSVTAPTDVEGFTFVQESGGIRQYTLEANGLQVLLYPLQGAPVTSVMITYHVGSRNERTGHTGATHMLEHLMFKGTERFNKERGTSIFDTLQRVGAEVNATTWLDRTNYYEMLPREYVSLALDIEADRMRNARLDPADVEAERTVILNEYDRGQNDPNSRLFDAVWSAAYVAHPYHHPTIGWRSDIESMQPEDLRHFYDTFYWPNNATLSLIGAVDNTEQTLHEVAEHFGTIPAASHDIPDVTTREPEQRGQRRVNVHQDGQLGALLSSYKVPHGRTEAADALDVLARILAAGKGSRLYQRCTDQELTTDVFAFNFRLRNPSLFSLFAFLTPSSTHETVEAAMNEEIVRIQDEGVTEEEIARAQRQLVAKEAYGRDGPYRIAAQLNEAIAVGDWTLYTTYLDRIRTVTPAAVQDVAQTYLKPTKNTVGWYIPEA